MEPYTLYLVGRDADDAQGNMPFDSHDSAYDYSQDNPGTNVYEVDAFIDFTTVRPVL